MIYHTRSFILPNQVLPGGTFEPHLKRQGPGGPRYWPSILMFHENYIRLNHILSFLAFFLDFFLNFAQNKLRLFIHCLISFIIE